MSTKMDVRKYIKIRGANENNLKNIDVDIPRNELVVLTGLSGSGKSSLAFDTIYAEGQRRYMESLSSYARQFLGQMEKPNVESIEGLSPAISIDQKSTNRNPRSTVGTVTEIYDYFRLLYARIGIPHCPKCGKPMTMNLRSDNTFVQDKGWYRAADRYAEFLRRHENLHILFLELGVGYNTPAIIKYPFWQMTAKNSKAVYACVNFGEAFCPKQIQSQAICINIDIHNFLRSNKANISIAKPWLFLIIIYNFHC